MLKKIQIFGAGLFVTASLMFAASEVMTPVASAAQQPANCCVVGDAATCAGGLVCKSGAPAGCAPRTPAYDGYCAEKKSGTVIIGGGDN
jgi:hypothetical protein